MRLLPYLSSIFLSLSLYGAIGSSVTIPVQEHLKYTFGNYRNHMIKSVEEYQYYKSMAPLNEYDIRKQLTHQEYDVHGIKLQDIASELVYQVYASDASGKNFKLFVDPANGSILKIERIQ